MLSLQPRLPSTQSLRPTATWPLISGRKPCSWSPLTRYCIYNDCIFAKFAFQNRFLKLKCWSRFRNSLIIWPRLTPGSPFRGAREVFRQPPKISIMIWNKSPNKNSSFVCCILTLLLTLYCWHYLKSWQFKISNAVASDSMLVVCSHIDFFNSKSGQIEGIAKSFCINFISSF